MSMPQMTSYVTQTSAVSTNTVNLNSVADGSWMLAVFEIGASTDTITAPTGWNLLLPITSPQTFGSRSFAIYGRIKQSGDSSFTWTLGTPYTNRLSVMWGTGGDIVANWQVGTIGVRNAGNVVAGQSVQAGSSTTSVSPSITTSVDDSLVLALNMEATLATETGPSSYSGGTEWFWSGTTGTYIESLHVLYNNQVSAGVVGDVTTTYPNAQGSNGAGIQIVITPSGTLYETPSVTGAVAETVFNLTGTGDISYNIAMPSGISVGDYVMVFVRIQSATVVTQPSMTGFDFIGRPQSFSSPGLRYNAIFGRKIISLSDIPASTVPITINQSTSGNDRALAESFRLTNVDLDNPVVSYSSGSSSSNGTITRSSYISSANALDIFYAASEFASPNSNVPLSYPSGFSSVITSGGLNPLNGTTATSRTYMYLGVQKVTSQVVPDATISWSVTSGSDAEGISIRGKSAALPAGVQLKDGLGNPIYLTYLDATLTRKVPRSVKLWLPGYATVTDLLADISRHPTMAHRGGSTNYPEFSEYGYDRSVMNGYSVLEFSCGWTSDLVPFGLANQYLDTAAGLPAGTNLDPTTITWASLSSTYQNQINPVAPGVYQPFYKLADFLAKYTPTHIVCVDPKYGFSSSTKVAKLLDICDANGGPSRIIIKFDSPVSDTTLTSAAHARGYKCMNYWGTDLTSLGSQQANWDILGYAYNASASDWTTVLSYGKPTWAAVIPNASGVTTAIASGAGLMMVKDVLSIPSVGFWNK